MADDSLEILIKFGLDDKKAKEAVERIREVERASESTGKKGAGATDALGASFKRIGTQLVGMLASYVSINAAVGAISQSVNQYVQQAGTSESTSKRWLEITQQIEFAQTDLGRSLATAVLPAYEDLADFLTNTIIPLLERAGKTVGILIQGPKDIHNAIEARAGAIASESGSYEEYTEEYNALMKKVNPYRRGIYPKLNESQWEEQGNYSLSNVEIYGRNAPLETGVDDSKYKQIQEYELMLNFKRQEMEATKSFENQQYRMKRDYDRSEMYAIEDFNRQRYRTLRDFNLQIQHSESEFYRTRAISQRDFNISLERSEYDYNLSRKRANEDHNFSLKQIMLSGDALQYYYSQRQFNIEKARAEEDYQRQRARSKEDFQRSQNDQLVQYQISRQFQLKQFEISLKDQEEDFKISRKRALEQYRIQQNDLYYNFLEQKRIRDNAFRAQYERLQTDEERLAKLKQKFTQAEIDSFELLATQGREFVYDLGKYLAQLRQAVYGLDPMTGSAPTQTFAEGGYTKPGPAYVHAGEYVLTANTTKALERVARGNQLTQESILQMAGGGGMQYVDNRSFARGMTADEKIMIKQELAQMVREAFG